MPEPSRDVKATGNGPFEPCPVCGAESEVETYQSFRPGFAVTQWRCPNATKRLTKMQIAFGKKLREGTHPMHKIEKEIGENEMPCLTDSQRQSIRTECLAAGISQKRFCELYLSIPYGSFTSYMTGSPLPQDRLDEIQDGLSKLIKRNADQADQAPDLTQDVLAANERQHQTHGETEEEPEDIRGLVETPAAAEQHVQQLQAAEQEVQQMKADTKVLEMLQNLAPAKIEISPGDLLDQAVAIIRQFPEDDRFQVLEIARQEEKLEQMQADFRARLRGEATF